MDMTIPLIVLAIVSVATGMWDLLRGNAKDVLRTAAFVELGLEVAAVVARKRGTYRVSRCRPLDENHLAIAASDSCTPLSKGLDVEL